MSLNILFPLVNCLEMANKCVNCKKWFDPWAGTYQLSCCNEKLPKPEPAKKKQPYNYRRQKEYRLKTKYGISLAQYNEMIIEQNNKCLICKLELNDKAVVDHCHSTGRVRGLLHNECNIMVGFIEKLGTDTVYNAIEYLL